MLMEVPFFMHSDPRIIRAGFWMLDAAWHSPVAGSIPSDFPTLSVITRLGEAEVAENYLLLTHGWVLMNDGRLHHAQLEALAESATERFGDQLAVMADSAALACQGGEFEFELLPPAEVAKKKRGKHQLPKDFRMDKATSTRAHVEGFTTAEHVEWLIGNFRDYAMADARLQADWQAACRKYLSSHITRNTFKSKFGYYPGQMPRSELLVEVAGGSAKDRLRQSVSRHAVAPAAATFKQRTASHNSNLMSDAMERRVQHYSAAEQRSSDGSMGSFDYAGAHP